MTGHAKTTKKATQEPRNRSMNRNKPPSLRSCNLWSSRSTGKNTSLARHVHTDIPPGQAGIAQLSSKKSGKNCWQQIVYCDVDGWSSWDFGWKHGESNIQWSIGLRHTHFFSFKFSPLNRTSLVSGLQGFTTLFWNQKKPVRLQTTCAAGKLWLSVSIGATWVPAKRAMSSGSLRGASRIPKKPAKELGGGNSNIFYFHPENWGRFPFWLIFFKGVETTN